jgi:capping protein beta
MIVWNTPSASVSASDKQYIQSDYNSEQQSFRSPWTNEYYPPLAKLTSPNDNNNNKEEVEEVGMKPSPPLRNLEIKANEVFESYTKLYYGKGNEVVSSVYFLDKDSSTSDSGGGGSSSTNYQHHTTSRHGSRSSRSTNSRNNNNHNDHVFKKGFGGCFLIHKSINDVQQEQQEQQEQQQQQQQQSGFWKSIHHVDFGPIINGKSKYTLSTTILLSIDIMTSRTDSIVSPETLSSSSTSSSSTSSSPPVHRIGASLSKEVEKTLPIHNPTDHIINIGKIIEDVEIELRSNMDVLYIQKTKEVIDSIRPSTFVSNSYGSYRGRRSGSGIGGRGRGGGAGGMMMGGIPMLPPGAQNEMNAALMARLKKSNPS